MHLEFFQTIWSIKSTKDQIAFKLSAELLAFRFTLNASLCPLNMCHEYSGLLSISNCTYECDFFKRFKFILELHIFSLRNEARQKLSFSALIKLVSQQIEISFAFRRERENVSRTSCDNAQCSLALLSTLYCVIAPYFPPLHVFSLTFVALAYFDIEHWQGDLGEYHSMLNKM